MNQLPGLDGPPELYDPRTSHSNRIAKPYNLHPVAYLNADSATAASTAPVDPAQPQRRNCRLSSSTASSNGFKLTSTATESTGSPLGSISSSSYTEASSAPDSPPSLNSPSMKNSSMAKTHTHSQLQNGVTSTTLPTLPTLSSLDSSLTSSGVLYPSLKPQQQQQQPQQSQLPSLSMAFSMPQQPLLQKQQPQQLQSSSFDYAEAPLQCKWKGCNAVREDAKSLYQHLCDFHVGRKANRNLTLNCQWDDCKVVTIKRDHITSHIRVHIPLKPYRCELCPKKFKRPQDLKKHVKVHAEEPKKYKNRRSQQPQPVQQQNQQRFDFNYPSSYEYSALPLPHKLASNEMTYDLPVPLSLPPPPQPQPIDNKKRKFDMASSSGVAASNLPFFYEDLKRSKILPTYNNEFANKLNSMDNYLNLAGTPSNNNDFSLPPLQSGNAKLGGFTSQQELLDASSFFNQMSTSMGSTDPVHSKTYNSSTMAMSLSQPANNNLSSSPVMYPVLPSGNNTISQGQFPQLGSRFNEGIDYVKKLNISSNQKSSEAEVIERLESLEISKEEEEEEEDDDHSSFYDESDLSEDESEDGDENGEYYRHLGLVNDIKEYLEMLVKDTIGEVDSEHGCVYGKTERRSLYPTIIV